MAVSTCFLRRHACKYFMVSAFCSFWMVREILLLERMMVMCQCLNLFRSQQLRFSPSIIITSIPIWPPHDTDWGQSVPSQSFKLGGGVLYHCTSEWIWHAPGQDLSHLDNDITLYGPMTPATLIQRGTLMSGLLSSGLLPFGLLLSSLLPSGLLLSEP